jgi:hypothetical protein
MRARGSLGVTGEHPEDSYPGPASLEDEVRECVPLEANKNELVIGPLQWVRYYRCCLAGRGCSVYGAKDVRLGWGMGSENMD